LARRIKTPARFFFAISAFALLSFPASICQNTAIQLGKLIRGYAMTPFEFGVKVAETVGLATLAPTAPQPKPQSAIKPPAPAVAMGRNMNMSNRDQWGQRVEPHSGNARQTYSNVDKSVDTATAPYLRKGAPIKWQNNPNTRGYHQMNVYSGVNLAAPSAGMLPGRTTYLPSPPTPKPMASRDPKQQAIFEKFRREIEAIDAGR
jgi:hypothetical protein